DTALFFQNRQWGFGGGGGRIDVHAYNITRNKFIWRNDDIDYDGNSSVYPPIYYKDRIYFKASTTLFCFDAFTGKIIWQNDIYRQTNGDLVLGNMILEEDKVFVHCNRGTLVAVNTDDGHIIWKVKGTGDTIDNMVYYDGKIYMGSGADGYLHSVNVRTGHRVWKEISPNRHCYSSASFSTSPITLDPETGYLYCNDGYFQMCVDVNK
ncbi:MAG: PQQ-binding-like beta-propeller repeat protein, partial [Bacteroidota bacterium]|nr:PQQ-binding-like beta-propeller repeat protein [Bacteroidota bacterium]